MIKHDYPDMPLTWEPTPGFKHHWQKRGRYIWQPLDREKLAEFIAAALRPTALSQN